MAGTSFDGDSVAVNVGFVGAVGAVEEEPHPAAKKPRATNKRDTRFIKSTPF
jgi:hypothetical protein